jgi:hypothetical protein
MPDRRAVITALLVGGAIGAYFLLWWRWPLVAALGIGLVIGGLTLVGTMSVAKDPAIADDAWRAAAPEFTDPRAEPSPDVPVRKPGPGPSTPPDSRRDRPSGD